MIVISRQRLFQAIFVIWVVLWANFTIRDLVKAGRLFEYRDLLLRPSAEAKRSYVFGDRFYEFLKICDTKIPRSLNYEIVGLEDGSLDQRRAAYLLYPRLESAAADYILVYNLPSFERKSYKSFLVIDKHRYVLKRER